MQESPRNTLDLIQHLRKIVGARHVLTGAGATRPYRAGYRFGEGTAAAVVRPGNLVEQWRVVRACVAADVAIITQASNTGLTGGSTPFGADYDRDVVIISTRRITGIQVVGGGEQVICLGGATLFELEQQLAPLGREPHSVIGSSCIGASVIGGICNNSGGALVQRGPAYTQFALFAHVDAERTLRLVNHLGVDLGSEPEQMLSRLERGAFTVSDDAVPGCEHAHDGDYSRHVRNIEAPTPARFNADPRRLFEASGSAGHVVVFAVRLDTFPRESESRVFYIGTNDPAELTTMRREILGGSGALPIAAEYIHRTAFDMAATYGKDTFLAIRLLGTARLPLLFRLKTFVDDLAGLFGARGSRASDRLLQWLSRFFPDHLPARMRNYRDRYAHHLLLKMPGAGCDSVRSWLRGRFPSGQGDFFECTPDEAAKAFLHRFAVAYAAVRYRAVHGNEVEDIVALDFALPRNARDWTETLPAELDRQILHRLYYGHFFCHVFHHDYVVAKGHDTRELEHALCRLLDERGIEYPAEHNVGHLYTAKPALAGFYLGLDPCNQFNPGLGHTSRRRNWGS